MPSNVTLILLYIFQKTFVGDVKRVMEVMYLFLPFPIFWALFDQQVKYKKITHTPAHAHTNCVTKINTPTSLLNVSILPSGDYLASWECHKLEESNLYFDPSYLLMFRGQLTASRNSFRVRGGRYNLDR